MTTALLKDTARLFTCAAADIDFLRCMIFSNFQIFKFACIFGISKFYMIFMKRFSVIHRASERGLQPYYVRMEDCMEAQNGLCLPGCPSRVSTALSWT